jgi:hypothetical protein
LWKATNQPDREEVGFFVELLLPEKKKQNKKAVLPASARSSNSFDASFIYP